MLPRSLPTTLAAMLIAAATAAPPCRPLQRLRAQPVKPGPAGKPDQRPDPVIRCAP